MMRLATAEGEKLRLGGQLLVGVFAPIADASIRGPLPKLPTRFLAMTWPVVYPISCSFPWVKVSAIG